MELSVGEAGRGDSVRHIGAGLGVRDLLRAQVCGHHLLERLGQLPAPRTGEQHKEAEGTVATTTTTNLINAGLRRLGPTRTSPEWGRGWRCELAGTGATKQSALR